MNAYLVPLTCPTCGADLEAVTEGAPVAGRQVGAICRCSECPPHIAEFLVVVRLMPVNEHRPSGRPSGRPPAACGTASGWKKHIREGTAPCEECREAHRRTVAESKRRSRQWQPA